MTHIPKGQFSITLKGPQAGGKTIALKLLVNTLLDAGYSVDARRIQEHIIAVSYEPVET